MSVRPRAWQCVWGVWGEGNNNIKNTSYHPRRGTGIKGRTPVPHYPHHPTTPLIFRCGTDVSAKTEAEELRLSPAQRHPGFIRGQPVRVQVGVEHRIRELV